MPKSSDSSPKSYENKTVDNKKDSELNRYLLLPFWEFAVLSTLMAAFFPWSLLFCLFAYILEETALIVQALVYDAVGD